MPLSGPPEFVILSEACSVPHPIKETGSGDYGAGLACCSRRLPRQCAPRAQLFEAVTMRNKNRTGWSLTLTCAGFLGRSAAAPQVVGKAQEDSKAIKAMVEETVNWYQVFSDASDPEAMAPQRVFAGRTEHAGRKNRTACSSCGPTRGVPRLRQASSRMKAQSTTNSCHCRAARNLVAHDAGRVIWSPATPGIAFKDIPGAPAPADNPAARLKQMKGLADRFKVAITGWKADKSDREELRLLLDRSTVMSRARRPDEVPAGSTEECSPLSRGLTRRPSSCWKRFTQTGVRAGSMPSPEQLPPPWRPGWTRRWFGRSMSSPGGRHRAIPRFGSAARAARPPDNVELLQPAHEPIEIPRFGVSSLSGP